MLFGTPLGCHQVFKVDITFMDSCTVHLLRCMNQFRTMKSDL
jgi:hypothetical protein